MNDNHLDLLNEFHQLINEICEISCTHHEYAGNISNELNQSIEKAIHDEFNTLYALHIEKLTAATGIELYALQTKNGITIPQRRRHWYTFWKKTPNPAAKAVEGEIYGNSELFFQDLLNRTAAITELAQEKQEAPIQNVTITTSEETPANNKPLQQPEAPTEPTPAPSPAPAEEPTPAPAPTEEPSPSPAPTEEPTPAPAPQKPAETWEEEHAIPSETIAKSSK